MRLPEPIYTYALENGVWIVRNPGGIKCARYPCPWDEDSARLTALLMDRYFAYRGNDFWTKEQETRNRERYFIWREMMMIMKERGTEV